MATSKSTRAPSRRRGPQPASENTDAQAAGPQQLVPPAVHFYGGKAQPQAFNRGVDTALASLLDMYNAAEDDDKELRRERMDAAIAALTLTIAGDSKTKQGAVVTILEYVRSFLEVSYSTDADPLHWRPLTRPWPGDDQEIPLADTLFFENNGAAYSVDSNHRARLWWSQTRSTPSSVADITEEPPAKPIGRTRFDVLRWQSGIANRDAEGGAK